MSGKHRVKQAVGFGILFYAAAMLVYLLCRVIVGERLVVVMLGNIFLHWLLLIAVFLLPWALLLRMWRHGGVLAVFAFAFVVIYGGRFVPYAHTRAMPDLRVMTFNTAAFYTSPDALVNYLAQSDVDIIALIELGELNGQVISEALLQDYPYQVIRGKDVAGKAILSRYPIVGQDVFTLRTQRPNLEAQVQVGQQTITVYAVHPPAPDEQRGLNFYVVDPDNGAEIDMLLQRVDALVPTLLLGDFNTTEHSPAYRHMRRAGLADAYRTAGFGFGDTYFVRGLPLTRIDYIWHTPHLIPVYAHVGERLGSDHAAVIADFRLR